MFEFFLTLLFACYRIIVYPQTPKSVKIEKYEFGQTVLNRDSEKHILKVLQIFKEFGVVGKLV